MELLNIKEAAITKPGYSVVIDPYKEILVEIYYANLSGRWVVRCLKDNNFATWKRKGDKVSEEIGKFLLKNQSLIINHKFPGAMEAGMWENNERFVVKVEMDDSDNVTFSLISIFDEADNRFISEDQLKHWKQIFVIDYRIGTGRTYKLNDSIFEDGGISYHFLNINSKEMVYFYSLKRLNCAINGITLPDTIY